MSDDELIEVQGVSKKFCRSLKRSLWYGVRDVNVRCLVGTGHQNELRKNEFWAVNDISFKLRRGECMGLIGPNGAGKSTLLKMLNGLMKPDKGTITLRGNVGALIELGAGFNPFYRTGKYLTSTVRYWDLARREIDQKFDAIVDFAETEEFIRYTGAKLQFGDEGKTGFRGCCPIGYTRVNNR